MSKIEELLKDRLHEKLDFEKLLQHYPWINDRDRYCVLSPDSDGLLCGLFMARFRGWKIVGFYDDKIGIINHSYLDKDLIFLDGEIFRKSIKSVGHHMLKLNKKQKVDLSGFNNCIQPNLMRNYDGKNDFRLKYPLATIHLLISIIAYADKKAGIQEITFDENAIAPLFFTDGVFNVLFSYPENVLHWLSYLRIHEDWNPLKNVFENEFFSVFRTMQLMHDFFKQRDELTLGQERGDRLKISSKNGDPYNIEQDNGELVKINENAVVRIKKFMLLMTQKMSWQFQEQDWLCWHDLKYYKFTKDDFKGRGWTLTNAHFEEFLALKPLSWAMTSSLNIEFTLETPSEFF